MKNGKILITISTALVMILSLTSCETITEINSCAGYKFIYPSKKDTIETQRQIAAHNKYHKHCLSQKKG